MEMNERQVHMHMLIYIHLPQKSDHTSLHFLLQEFQPATHHNNIAMPPEDEN